MSRQHRDFGRLGGLKKAANMRARRGDVDPYPHPFVDFLEAVGLGGPSRLVWRTFWKIADGLTLEPAEVDVFCRHTGRTTPPTAPASECWLPMGRRAGKSENMTARATWRSISRNWRAVLRPGEVGTIPLIASDQKQAENSLGYLKGLIELPLVAPYVARVLKHSVQFHTGAVVRVATASWRSTRGYTMLDAILEECAFYRVEGSANPDEEILTAIRPAMLTVPDARIYGISSPYAPRGVLHAAFTQHWGRDGSDILVFCADTLSANPLADARKIAREFEQDPVAAASEYGRDGLVTFRHDVGTFLSREAIAAVTEREVFERPPLADVQYVAHVDPAGGGGADSYTLAIAHREEERAVLDALRETRPRFSPEQVTADYAQLLKAYRIADVTGDRYAGEFPRELFRAHGITYTPAERTTSDWYREFLPLVNGHRVGLLDHPKLATQLALLERRVAPSGRDTITHPPGGHDDLAAVAAGALVRAVGGAQQVTDVTFPVLLRVPEVSEREVYDPLMRG